MSFDWKQGWFSELMSDISEICYKLQTHGLTEYDAFLLIKLTKNNIDSRFSQYWFRHLTLLESK